MASGFLYCVYMFSEHLFIGQLGQDLTAEVAAGQGHDAEEQGHVLGQGHEAEAGVRADPRVGLTASRSRDLPDPRASRSRDLAPRAQ